MSAIKKNVQDLNNMILEGKILEAFEKYYADDVVMQDNFTEKRKGKKACRQFEESFVENLVEFRGAEVKNVLVSEEAGTAAIEWHFDYTHKEWGERDYRQVAVQKWDNDKIVSEQFLYND